MFMHQIPNTKSSYCKSASDMSLPEIANWFSLCNGIKFINNHSNAHDIPVDENDLDGRSILNYINSVSGDIQTSLKEKGGIPFKYSLDPNHEESKNVEELYYV